MDYQEAVKSIDSKLTAGEATITREEWEAIKGKIQLLQDYYKKEWKLRKGPRG
jgi:hypothetical protein